MSGIFRNNSKRLRHRLNQLILMFLLTGVGIGVALFMNQQKVVLGRFAVVGELDLSQKDLATAPFKFISVATQPTKAELMLGKYDGYLEIKEAEELLVSAPKKSALAESVTLYLKASEEERETMLQAEPQTVSKIIGFLMMFVLIGGLTFLVLVGEDRERGQLERLLVSPMFLSKYLISQCLYGFVGLFVPTFSLFLILQGIFAQELGASLWTYTWLLALLCLLAVSFATMMMSVLPNADSGNMIGSALLILTTIISGSFGSLGTEHTWFLRLSQLLPQKNLLLLTEQIDLGVTSGFSGYLTQIVLSCALFLMVAVVGLKKNLHR